MTSFSTFVFSPLFSLLLIGDNQSAELMIGQIDDSTDALLTWSIEALCITLLYNAAFRYIISLQYIT